MKSIEKVVNNNPNDDEDEEDEFIFDSGMDLNVKRLIQESLVRKTDG